MPPLSIIISIIAGAILGVLVDWLLKSWLPKEPTRQQRIIGFLVIFILVFISAQSLIQESNRQPISPTIAIALPPPSVTPTMTSLPTIASPTRIAIATSTKVPSQVENNLQPYSGLSGRIAFQSYRDGNAEIYVMNADGSQQTNLTKNPAHDKHPSWSPDGKRIAFDSSRDGNSQIYVMNADGSGVIKLTTNGDNLTPAWSPDGKRIAFASYRDGGYMALYVMNIDGSGQTRLTDNKADHWFPTWSPDSRRIAFASNSPSPGSVPYSIFVGNADGSGIQQVTTDAHKNDSAPNWSPDGKWIVYSRSISPTRSDIMLVDSDGSAYKNLSGIAADNIGPSWSPDNKWIAFSSDRDGNYKIYLMRPDGSGQIQLTNTIGDDWYPVWK